MIKRSEVIAIPDQTKTYQRLEKDVIARRKVLGVLLLKQVLF